jgi:hypothetical protein
LTCTYGLLDFNAFELAVIILILSLFASLCFSAWNSHSARNFYFILKGLSYEKDWASLNNKKQSRASASLIEFLSVYA